MRRKLLVFSILLAIGIASFWKGYSLGKERDLTYKKLDILAEALAIIEKAYVTDGVTDKVIDGALEGGLASLDAYSQFLSPQAYKDLLVETEGHFGGLGIEITIKDGILTVVSPIEDTPAWKAGVKAGDVIIKIDGQSTKEITLNAAVKKLRGEPGTKVTLTIWREEERKGVEISVERADIKIKDIKRAEVLENDIGYLRITEFRETTAQELDKALSAFKSKPLKGMIIDVRNNPGGLLDSTVDVVSRFLENGKTIVSTQSRYEKERLYTALPAKEKYLDIPLVVLINRGSASGSEILAAALRENNRAILLGETTFGKGSVQTIIPLSDGSALRLTTSKYYTPKKISIHEKGIAPDVEVKEKDKDKKTDVFEQIEGEKDFDYKNDYQITRALDLIKGLLVLETGKK